MENLFSVKSLIPLFFIAAGITAAAQQNIDVLHYRFHISVSDDNDSISGSAIIRFAVKEKRPEIQFDLVSVKKNGKGMMATAAGFKTSEGINEAFRQENDKLIIPSRFNTGDTAEVTINYKGIPANGLIISKNKYERRTFFGDNWPDRAHHWLPCVDDPADKASVEFIVTAPSHYQVVANGIQTEETNLAGNKKLTHWKEDVPLPTKVMVIGVAEFAVNSLGDVNCIPVSSWVFPENRKEGFYDYATAKDVLQWHINYIGPYAYKKLANVQSKTMFGGMENAGAIFYYEGSVSGHRAEEELQSHEIVHQWFGNHATEKSFAHIWLSEGFATYLTHVYTEAKYGMDSLNKRMAADRQTVFDFVNSSKRPVVDTTRDFMKLLNANSYQKGSWVLHMLRRQLGDAIFHKSIRDYYAAFAGKNAETKDLKAVFEKNSGKKLDKFFEQWLYRNENPKLELTWKYEKNKKQVLIQVKQTSQTVFDFPLQVSLITKSGAMVLKTINIDKKESRFNVSMPEHPKYVVSDPFTNLLAEVTVKEVK